MNRYSFNPFPILKTDRLHLNQFLEGDAKEILELRSNPQIIQFIKRDPYISLNEADEFISKIKNGILSNEWISWALRIKSKKNLIGTICLWNFSDNGRIAEIGYDLLPHYQNMGYMSEAINKVLDYGFKTIDLDTIEAFTDKSNLASKKLLQKFYFEFQPNRKDEHNDQNEIFVLRSPISDTRMN